MIVWRGPNRIAHWASFLVFFAAFGLWTLLASEVSKDPAWPATALGIVALLVVVVFALAWAGRGAVKSEGSSLFPAFDGVPSWVGLALALIGLGCVAAGAYSYYVHDREFWIAVQFYVVGFGAMALSQALPRFRRPFARD
ncbi:MAG: hypothetical protein OXG74_02640 [Acidobacteria bacterium]|nr:hypothetical protein [Acidobacteriota bacterium]MCY3968804.1 hypothetical protein [Acidobacteriota bacterium]